MKVIFILGSGHCGSTVLDLVLDSHSKIAGLGEVHAMGEKMLCTCGKLMPECPFWQRALLELEINPLEIFRPKFSYLLDSDKFYYVNDRGLVDGAQFTRNNEKLFANIMRPGNIKAIVDSSKNPDRAALLSQSENIEPIMVHLVRNGKAVTRSYIKKYGNIWPQFFKWFLANLKIEILKRRTKKARWIFIKYEKMINNPESEVRKILSAANLSFEDGMLDFRGASHHEIGGNDMRFGKSLLGRKDDSKWRTEMPVFYRFLFNLFFGWLNFYYARKK